MVRENSRELWLREFSREIQRGTRVRSRAVLVLHSLRLYERETRRSDTRRGAGGAVFYKAVSADAEASRRGEESRSRGGGRAVPASAFSQREVMGGVFLCESRD